MLTYIEKNGEIARVYLNRPEKKNALSPALILELHKCIDTLKNDSSSKIVIIEGVGDVFCAGMDLKNVISIPDEMSQMLTDLARLTYKIRHLKQLTIAKVKGAAVGGGCGFMAVCDFAWTHPEAKIGCPEVSLGVCPAVVAPWLIKKIGIGQARSILLQGGTFTGDKAYKIGLATHISENEALEDSVTKFANKLTEGCENAIQITKNWLNKLDGSSDEKVLLEAAELSAKVINTRQTQDRLKKLYGN